MFYGWRLVAGLFVILSLSSGLGFYNHAVLIQALAESGRFSIETASSGVSLFFFVSGIAGIGLAPMLERFDVRWIVCSGACLSALGLWWIGGITTNAELYLVYALFGLGFCGSGLLPATTLIARWFILHRARALSIASTGLSVGGMLVTPVSAYWIQTLGLTEAVSRQAFLYVLVVVPVTLWLLRSAPADVGLVPDGYAQQAPTESLSGRSFEEGIRDPFFWWLNIAYLVLMLAQVGAIAHQYGLLTERLPSHLLAAALMILPLSSVVGRLIGGFALDRISMFGFTLLMMLGQALSLLILAFAQPVWLIALGLAALGFTVGNLLMLQPLIMADRYGLKSYSRLFSWANFMSVLGVASGPGLMGWLFALSGGYQWPFLLASAAGGLAALLFLGCRLSARPNRSADGFAD